MKTGTTYYNWNPSEGRELTDEERAELVRQYEESESEDEHGMIPPGGCCILCIGAGCLFWVVVGLLVAARVAGHFFINNNI